MSDKELETWQREWRRETELLPELKQRIKRQDRRVRAGAVLLCVCLIVSTLAAIQTGSWFAGGVAAGVWVSTLLLGSYSWRLRRGTWKPSAQTTHAYLELLYNRATVRVRSLRVGSYVLGTTAVLYLIFLMLEWLFSSHAATHTVTHLWGLSVIVAIVAEFIFYRWYERRKRKEMNQARKVLLDLRAPE